MPPRKPKPTTATITPSDWDRIVDVYRRHGGYSNAVAIELGFPVARTRRLFYRGLPSRGYPPIRTLVGADEMSTEEIRAKRVELEEDVALGSTTPEPIEETKIEAQAMVIHASEQARLAELVRLEDERRAAREDMIKTRAEEATMVSINRRNAIALNGVTSMLLKGAAALSESIQKELEEEAATSDLTLNEKLSLIRSASSVARFNAEATLMAVKAERMVLGQPIQPEADTPDDGTLDQAVAWIETSIRAVNLARARGLLAKDSEKETKH